MKYFTLLSFAIFGNVHAQDLHFCGQACNLANNPNCLCMATEGTCDDVPGYTTIRSADECNQLTGQSIASGGFPTLTQGCLRAGESGPFYYNLPYGNDCSADFPCVCQPGQPVDACDSGCTLEVHNTFRAEFGQNIDYIICPDLTTTCGGDWVPYILDNGNTQGCYKPGCTDVETCCAAPEPATCADTPADFCAGTKKDVTCSGAVCTKSECCEPKEQAFPIFYAYCSIFLGNPSAQMSSTVNLQIVEYDESVNFGGCASKGYKALGDPSQQVTWDDPTTGATWIGVEELSNKDKNMITAQHCSSETTGTFFYESLDTNLVSISGNQISYNGKNYQICVPCYTSVQALTATYYEYPHLKLKYDCSTLDASFTCVNTDGVSRCQVPPPTKCEDDNTFQCQNGVVSGDLSNGDDPHANCACTCDSGWEGASCDTACSSGWTGSGCTEAIQCTQGSKGPCQNGGTATGLEHDNSCACDCPVGFGGYECEHDISNLNVKTETIRANGLYNKVEKRAQLKDLGKKVLESKLAAGMPMKQAIKDSRVNMTVDDYGTNMKVFLTRLTDGGKALKMAVGPENAGVQDACEAKGADADADDCGMFDLADDSADSTTTLISTASEGSYTIVVDGDEIISKQTQVTNGYKMECWNGTAWGSTTFFTGLDEDTEVRDRLYTCKGRVLIVGSQGGFCTSESCSGHGECVQVEDSYTCNCHQDYAGGTCEVECLNTDRVTYQNVCGCTC